MTPFVDLPSFCVELARGVLRYCRVYRRPQTLHGGMQLSDGKSPDRMAVGEPVFEPIKER